KIVGPFGLAPGDPTILERLTQRSFERRGQLKALADKNAELKKMAPEGIVALSSRVRELNSRIAQQTELQAAESGSLPDDQGALKRPSRHGLNRPGERLNSLKPRSRRRN